MERVVLLFIVALLCAVEGRQTGQQAFQADVSIYNDPQVNGILKGHMYYDYPNLHYRLDYDFGVQEVIDYQNRLRYLHCGSTCDTETWNSPMPIYFPQTGDASVAAVTVPGRGSCTGYRKSNVGTGQVQYVYVDAATGYICRAIFLQAQGAATATTIDFTNIAAQTDPSVFNIYTTWNCPQPQCSKKIDFMLVIDDSGSIDPTSFRAEKDFVIGIANAYTFGPQYVAMGAVYFSTVARIVSPLTVVQQSFINAINNAIQTAGSTCIGCGIQLAHDQVNQNGRAGVQKVFIVLTDGRNNVQTSGFQTILDSAKNAGIIFFAIGVAQAVDAEMRNIASNIAGVQTVFFSPDFAQLHTILDQVIISTCVDIQGSPCGAGCFGFCSCGATCICPSSCDDGNACTSDTCTPGQGGNGCVHAPLVCNDNNQCTDDSCVAAVGCQYLPHSCDDNDPCTNDSCIQAAGCQHIPADCNDNNPCTSDTCQAGVGCTHTTVSCNLCTVPVPVQCPNIPCKISECNPAFGNCTSRTIDCNDNNVCTTDACDPATSKCTYTSIGCNDGNACTHDYCDPRQGCIYIAYNISTDCNDYDVCTTDSCDNNATPPGCVHTNITCADNDSCTANTCNSILGCQYPILDCSQDPHVKQYISSCYLALCANDHNGCYLQQIDGTHIDNCQVCNGDGSTCQVGLSTGQVVGLSAGILAVIIIAAIIVLAALGIFGGKKGYDVWLKHRGNMATAQTSPIYVDGGLSGTNALYEGGKK